MLATDDVLLDRYQHPVLTSVLSRLPCYVLLDPERQEVVHVANVVLPK